MKTKQPKRRAPANLKRLFQWFENLGPIKFFLITGAFFGLIFLFLTPPFQAPDEPVHFFRAYQISTFDPTVNKIGGKTGGQLPSSLEDTVTLTTTHPIISFTPNHKYNLEETKKSLSIKTDNNKTQTYDFSTTAYYSPVSYLPQTVGVFVGRVLHSPPIIMMYLGRLCNLAAWLVMFGIAIAWMPRKKWALAFIGLLPMALFQATSLSSDVMAIGVLALAFVFILKLMEGQEPKISRNSIIILICLLTGLALSKQAMFIFLPLVFLIPNKRFESTKQGYLVKLAAIAIPMAIFGVWMLRVGDISFSSSANGIDPPAQLKYILHHPLGYLRALLNTYLLTWGDGITRSFIGNFGWVDTPLAEGFTTIGYIMLFLVMFGTPEKMKQWLSNRQKVLVVLVGAAYVGAVSTALYQYLTPVGFRIVIGLVGRYYLPVALLLIPVVVGSWLLVSRRAYQRIAVYGPIFLLIISIMTLTVRYYITNV